MREGATGDHPGGRSRDQDGRPAPCRRRGGKPLDKGKHGSGGDDAGGHARRKPTAGTAPDDDQQDEGVGEIIYIYRYRSICPLNMMH